MHLSFLGWTVFSATLLSAQTSDLLDWEVVSTLSGSQANDYFGISVSLTDDLLVVGKGNGLGAQVFELSESKLSWHKISDLNVNRSDVDESYQFFGFSVAISPLDNTIAVADIVYDDDKGAVYIFESDDNTNNASKTSWTHTATLDETDNLSFVAFYGRKSAFDHVTGTLAIASNNCPGFGISSGGCIFLYEKDEMSGNWNRSIVSPYYQNQEIAINNNTLMAGYTTDTDKGNLAGAVFIFSKNLTSGVWQFEDKIYAQDARDEAYFGSAVALYGDVAVIGSHGFSNGTVIINTYEYGDTNGKAYIFKKDINGTWQEMQSLWPGNIYNGTGGNGFGVRVAMDRDGTVLVADSKARTFIFEMNQTSQHWERYLQPFTCENNNNFAEVAIYGNYSAVGCKFVASQTGEVNVLARGGLPPTKAPTLLPTMVPSVHPSARPTAVPSQPTSAPVAPEFLEWDVVANLRGNETLEQFGLSVALSGDLLVVGSNGFGATVFEATGLEGRYAWRKKLELSSLVTVVDVDENDCFGFNVAVSRDANMIAVSALYYSNWIGAVFIFELDESGINWTHTAILDESDSLTGYVYAGWRCEFDPFTDTLAVTAEDCSGFGISGGCIMLYDKDEMSGNWTRSIVSPYYQAGDIAISNNSLMTGHTGNQDKTTFAGTVHVWNKNLTSNEWEYQGKIYASDPKVYTYFGRDVAMYNDVAVVGCDGYWEVGWTTDRNGKLYVFKKNEASGIWEEIYTLTPPPETINASSLNLELGKSVAISDDGTIFGGDFQTHVYVFEMDPLRPWQRWLHTQEMNYGASYTKNTLIINGNYSAIGSVATDDYAGEVNVLRRGGLPPTQMPTIMPSMQPSSVPSNEPSMQPSGVPSDEPSVSPTMLPTHGPTDYMTEFECNLEFSVYSAVLGVEDFLGSSKLVGDVAESLKLASVAARDDIGGAGQIAVDIVGISAQNSGTAGRIGRTERTGRRLFAATGVTFDAVVGVVTNEVRSGWVDDLDQVMSEFEKKLKVVLNESESLSVLLDFVEVVGQLEANASTTSGPDGVGDGNEKNTNGGTGGTKMSSRLEEMYPYTVGTIAAVLCVVAMVGLVDAQCVRKNERFLVASFFVVFMYVMDLLSDLFFVLEVWFYSNGVELFDFLIFCLGLMFVVLPIISSIMSLQSSIKKWRRDTDNGSSIESWLRESLRMLYFLIVLTGGSTYSAILICNSNFLQLPLFDMSLTKRQQRQFRNKRMFTVILMENIPQLILQVSFSVYYQVWTVITIFATIFSVISIVITIFEFFMQRLLISTETYVVLKVDVISDQVAILSYGDFCRKIQSTRVSVQRQLAKMLQVQTDAVELLKPIQAADGVLLLFHITSETLDGSQVASLLEPHIDNGRFVSILCKYWQQNARAEREMKIGNIETKKMYPELDYDGRRRQSTGASIVITSDAARARNKSVPSTTRTAQTSIGGASLAGPTLSENGSNGSNGANVQLQMSEIGGSLPSQPTAMMRLSSQSPSRGPLPAPYETTPAEMQAEPDHDPDNELYNQVPRPEDEAATASGFADKRTPMLSKEGGEGNNSHSIVIEGEGPVTGYWKE